jgi:hypothetical protein
MALDINRVGPQHSCDNSTTIFHPHDFCCVISNLDCNDAENNKNKVKKQSREYIAFLISEHMLVSDFLLIKSIR